ncbi:MAG: ABC transporter transmembrane domain-containing protein, partial [Novosphingobium sp.]
MDSQTVARDLIPVENPDESAAANLVVPRPVRSLGPLRMIWRQALHYPGHLMIAFAALITTSAATSYIPSRFKEVIDKGFTAKSQLPDIDHAFELMMVVIVVLGLGTAFRFYYVSWLGERVVGDVRKMVQSNLLRMPPSFFESNSPAEISSRMTSDTALIEVVVGTTVSVALRNLLIGVIS